ncbi:MAG: hypothetical protein ACREHD_03775, partial [Pirellulales bacterium]
FIDRMLVLPNGQVLFSAGDSFGNTTPLFLYTPSGSPQASWRPSIGGIVSNGGGSFTLSGVQLNGISEGAYYGDDAEMAENYPILQFRSPGGQVYYATTSNWDSQSVQTGSRTVTTDFELPAGMPVGTYYVTVSAAGISSVPRLLYIGPADVPPAGTQPEPLGTAVGQGTTAAPGPGTGLAPADLPDDNGAEPGEHAVMLHGPSAPPGIFHRDWPAALNHRDMVKREIAAIDAVLFIQRRQPDFE